MKVLCVFSRYNYGNPARGIGYEYASFVPTLERLGHEVHFLETRDRTQYADFIGLNRALLQQVERIRPDVVLAVLTSYEIWLESWQLLRDSGLAATVNWTTDDSWKYAQFSRFVAPALHAFTTTYPRKYVQYQKDGIAHVLLTQWAAQAGILQPPRPAAECPRRVTFVGTAHGDRRAWVEAARRRGVPIECFGHGWPAGPVATERVAQIINESVISVNFANGAWVWHGLWPRQQNQLKARVFETPGAGGFMLTESAEGLERYYRPGEEVATFASVDELVERARYFLDHPAERDRIAQAGFARTRRDHTYEQRLPEVLQFALEQKRRFEAGRPAAPTGRIDWARFAEAAQRHRLNRRLKGVRSVLLAGCSGIWGPERGPRAARRILFELSWRLAGARTYSAAGWPGRMFCAAS